jgi:hypothetical protein
MVRTQIQLEENQIQWLKKVAGERGISVSQMIREGLALYREKENRIPAIKRERALAAVGRFASNHSDGSERHDDYLSDAFDASPSDAD